MTEEMGLKYLIEDEGCIERIALSMNTKNPEIKKNLYIMLTALCALSTSGYERAIDILECHKKMKHYRHRFKVVIEDLEGAETIGNQIAVLTFINYVIMTPTDLAERIKIRNEFIGLQILPLLKYLRKVADSVDEIIGQLDVFDENREVDEAQNQHNPNAINLNSHLEIFYSILNQVAETPHEVIFLSILQHLLRIDSKEGISNVIWNAAEKMVHRATLLESNEDAARLLRTQNFQCTPMASAADIATRFSHHHQLQAQIQHNLCQATSTSTLPRPPPPPPLPPPPPTLKQLMTSTTQYEDLSVRLQLSPRLGGGEENMKKAASQSSLVPPPSPPGKNDQEKVMGPPPPPPPPPNMLGLKNALGPPPPPPPMPMGAKRPLTPEEQLPAAVLPQKYTPEPKLKMKTINWNKIPEAKVLGTRNIWKIIAGNHEKEQQHSIDFEEMEKLFSNPLPSSPQLSGSRDTTDRKSNKKQIVILLDSRFVLNTNIFLRQFRLPKCEIVDAIRTGNEEIFSLEKLQNLNKIISDTDFETLRSYAGDRSSLDEAVLFLMELMELSGFKLRAAGMLLKAEFDANFGYLASCIDSMLITGQDMMENKLFEEIMYLVVVSGNFINCGGYGGNAAGIRFSSLSKLTEVRSQNKNITLMNFIALEAKKQKPELLTLPQQFPNLEQATKTTVEQITAELKQLETRVRKIKKEVEAPNTDEDIKENMLEFLEKAQDQLAVIGTGLESLEILRIKLAEFICEDENAFTLEECYKTFFLFCNRFQQAHIDNELREKLKNDAEIRKKRADDTKQAKRISNDIDLSSPMPIRRRMGSCAGIDQGNANTASTTPDLTPNGSLRRRNNHRVLPGEDELMQFLRTSGNEHTSRERKSYGSLDRSWSKRSANRKKHELLNADFSTSRERANSPVPLTTEQKPKHGQEQHENDILRLDVGSNVSIHVDNSIENDEVLHQQDNAEKKEHQKPRISHMWRSKIETWLLLNEIDNKQNDEYKRKRRMANEQRNRRSLENEAESERKLQTLPEEDKTNSLPTIAAGGLCNSRSNNNHTSRTYINEQYKPVYLDKMPISILERNDLMISKATPTINATTILNKYLPEAKEQQQQHSKGLVELSEDNRRRSLIQQLGDNQNDANEHVEMYVRRPRLTAVNAANDVAMIMMSPPQSPNKIINRTTTTTSTTVPPPSVATTMTSSDNITEPKIDATPNNMMNKEDACNFDRYAVERRTRRFKRAADNSSNPNNNNNNNHHHHQYQQQQQHNNEDDLATLDNQNDVKCGNYQQNTQNDMTTTTITRTPPPATMADETNPLPNDETKMVISSGTRKNLEKIGRRFSSINQEDVQKAKRNLKSPTDHMANDMRIWKGALNNHDEKNISQLAKNTKTRNWTTLATKNNNKLLLTTPFCLNKPNDITTGNSKISNSSSSSSNQQQQQQNQHHHEQLNDEGFEETQSLVSDTPSHNNNNNNNLTSNAQQPHLQVNNSKNKMPKLTATTMRTNPVTKTNSRNRLADRLQIAKLRTTTPSAAATTTASGIKSYINNTNNNNNINNSRKSNNIMNNQISQNALKVQRAGGGDGRPRMTTNYRQQIVTSANGDSHLLDNNNSPRQSLRSSSHSSINSANSINTVKRMPHNNSNSHVVVVHRKNSNSSSISNGSQKKLEVANVKKPLTTLQNYQHVWPTSTTATTTTNRTTTAGASGGIRSYGNNRQPAVRSTSTTAGALRKTNRVGKIYNGANPTTTATTTTTLVAGSLSGTPTKTARNDNSNGHLASTSFKENREQHQHQPTHQLSAATTARINGFMRPTTSSATKRHN